MNEEQRLSKSLDYLFSHLISGLEEDLAEVTTNVDAYFELIDGDPDQRALFGTLYNDSLKIKGSVRERYLKTINSIKERLGKLENDRLKDETKKGSSENAIDFNHNEMSQILKDLKKSGKLAGKDLDVEKIKKDSDFENKEYEDGEELEYVPKKDDK